MNELYPDPELDQIVQELNRLQERRAAEASGEVDPGGETGETAEGPEIEIPAPSPRPAAAPPPERERRLDPPDLALVEEGADLEHLLTRMVRKGASDLHLVAGLPPVVRIDGRLARLEEDALDGDDLGRLFRPHLGERGEEAVARRGAADFTLRPAPCGATGMERDRGRGGRSNGSLRGFRLEPARSCHSRTSGEGAPPILPATGADSTPSVGGEASLDDSAGVALGDR